jgi:hypothetical protein
MPHKTPKHQNTKTPRHHVAMVMLRALLTLTQAASDAMTVVDAATLSASATAEPPMVAVPVDDTAAATLVLPDPQLNAPHESIKSHSIEHLAGMCMSISVPHTVSLNRAIMPLCPLSCVCTLAEAAAAVDSIWATSSAPLSSVPTALIAAFPSMTATASSTASLSAAATTAITTTGPVAGEPAEAASAPDMFTFSATAVKEGASSFFIPSRSPSPIIKAPSASEAPAVLPASSSSSAAVTTSAAAVSVSEPLAESDLVVAEGDVAQSGESDSTVIAAATEPDAEAEANEMETTDAAGTTATATAVATHAATDAMEEAVEGIDDDSAEADEAAAQGVMDDDAAASAIEMVAADDQPEQHEEEAQAEEEPEPEPEHEPETEAEAVVEGSDADAAGEADAAEQEEQPVEEMEEPADDDDDDEVAGAEDAAAEDGAPDEAEAGEEQHEVVEEAMGEESAE